ncbi:hypothetical protein O181_068703 [Austropuccinia psidii MF-1]|uniref:Reverse transcriptase RNase H-like domain-containing protein n=1 Tax=Austropuccinia psidii MF-1 TaxID=1389203 RepID=A0A9Q3F0W0_9BASI|nr:hypothetical protein [Austropuccinia psidii MF-1]
MVETDASNYALGAVLSQVSDSGKHPTAFDSRKPIPAELNYEIHEKELLGIVWALKHLRAFLLSLSPLFEVLTNHSSLQYFMSSKKLKISRDLSAAYHSETDRQPERENQILQQYLWIDPQFDSAHITQDNLAGKLSTKIQSVQQDVKRETEVAINRFKRYAAKSRASPPVFNPGDMVCLSSKNIKSTRPTKKLSERWLGPFPILKKVSTHAYHLKLPTQWKSLHPVFHISLLEPFKTSTIPNKHQEPPPPIIIGEEEE